MPFDSNRAWREATVSLAANREVLLAVAGVFFLLPGFASVIFLSDFQADLLTNLGNSAATERIMAGMTGPVVSFGIVSFLLQSLGYLALLALLTDRARPTVGQALGIAIRALPTVVGAALLFFAGYLGVVLVLVVFAAAASSATGPGAIAAMVGLLMIAGVIYAMVKMSLALPVIVIERVSNPVTALARSWRLTRGNSFRLFFFYLLLAVVYFVVVMVVGVATMGAAVLIAGQGKLATLVGGLVSAIVGAVASALLAAVLAAIHRQLAGASPDVLGSTFD